MDEFCTKVRLLRNLPNEKPPFPPIRHPQSLIISVFCYVELMISGEKAGKWHLTYL